MTTTAPELTKVTDELFASIGMLLEQRRERSTLILLYAAIDILGALDTSSGKSTRSSFMSWADKYMDPPTALGCSSLELYSARCGLLHALSSDTNLTATGAAREFVYVSYPPVFAAESAGRSPFVLHIGNLWQCFRAGAGRFFADVVADQTRTALVERNLDRVYVTRGSS